VIDAMTRQLHLTYRMPDDEAAALEGTFLDERAYDVLLTADADVYKPDGEPLIRFRKNVLPSDVIAEAFKILRKIKQPVTNRGTAAGITDRVPYIRKDGTKSKSSFIAKRDYPEAADISSAVIGFLDRYVRMPYCRLTAFNLDKPREFAKCVPFVRAVDAVFKASIPERYAAQMAFMDKTENDWKIKGTAFTTVTVNKNFRTAVHKDRGDLKEGFGVITVLQGGIYAGGYLCFPQYRVAVDMRNADVLMCDVHEWHGNTPIYGERGRFERVSCVFYYRANLHLCGSAEEELERAKSRKPGDALYDDNEFGTDA
jgi:hypothetical protein